VKKRLAKATPISMTMRHFGNNRRRHNNSTFAETFRFVARRYRSLQSDSSPYLLNRPELLHIAIDPDQGFREKLRWIEVPDEG